MILLMADLLNPVPSGYFVQCYNTQAVIHHGHASGSH